MKLLISTYACSPHHGSEHAVGWNWVTEAHRQGHEVWAMAADVHREAIEAACRSDPGLDGITWMFPTVQWWKLAPGIEPHWERTYNLLWQRAALRTALDLNKLVGFDVVHHLTWGGIRAPTFLGRLNAPLIIGPIGGGETSPPSLRSGLHPKARATEFIRNLSNLTITINPIVRDGLTRAHTIFVKTPESAGVLSKSMQDKSVSYAELSVQPDAIGKPRTGAVRGCNILFVGRLIYWKGAHIALRALAELAVRVPEATLTIVGKGPELPSLRRDATRLGIADRVTFTPWVPRNEISAVYDRNDLFVFPSLHDSSGLVVLEALSRGLPVICLDSGGPRLIVTPQSGVVVSAHGRDTSQVAAAMANEIAALFHDKQRLAALSAGAVARARQFILQDRVAEFYSFVKSNLGLAADTAAVEKCGSPGRPDLDKVISRHPEWTVSCEARAKS